MLEEDTSARLGYNPVSKEISKGISYLDLVNRIRDLETKYIDLSSNQDRRIQNFIEENPQRIYRHLKVRCN